MSQDRWSVIAANELDVQAWSYGLVKEPADLYSPRIFGPTRDLRCECGATHGVEAVGETCPDCLVDVERDAKRARRQKLGRIELASHWRNPFTNVWLTEIPVIPIGFRMGDDGVVNELGRSYESLVQLNCALAQTLPPRYDEGYFSHGLMNGHVELDAVLKRVFGAPGDAGAHRLKSSNPSCLRDLLHDSFMPFDPDVGIILRACGFAIEIVARL